MATFTILGGGIAGVSAALELAKAGHEIILIERFSTLLSGSSDNTPCRLGLGFHYVDVETAIKYLHSTIHVLKKYPQFVIGNKLAPNHPYRRGRYFVVKDSLFPLSKVIALHEALQTEYARLVAEDETNQVLGEPSDFSQLLTVDSYQSHVNTKRVIAAFETAEQTLDWPRLKAHLTAKVNSHPNIKVITNTEVIGISPGDKSTNYSRHKVKLQTHLSDGKTIESEIPAENVINSTWENIELLNQSAGFPMTPDSRTNRTKVMIEIELPPDFEKTEPVNSMFFCFGPHAAFTNTGNGKGYITFEPVTNVKDEKNIEQQTMALTISAYSERLLAGKATEEEKARFGEQIIQGIVDYIPALAGAKVLSAHFGNVRTEGKVKLNDPNSLHHKRNKDDIESMAVGFIKNPSMKLLYFLEGSKKVKAIANSHLKLDKKIKRSLADAPPTANNPLLAQVVRQNLDRIVESSTFHAPHASHLITQKAAVLTELHNFKRPDSGEKLKTEKKKLEKPNTAPTRSIIWSTEKNHVRAARKNNYQQIFFSHRDNTDANKENQIPSESPQMKEKSDATKKAEMVSCTRSRLWAMQKEADLSVQQDKQKVLRVISRSMGS